MQTPRSSQHKNIKFLDVKIFLAAVSLAVTLGLWNLFSNQAIQANQVDQAEGSPPAQAASAEAGESPPLPTLVPLVDLSVSRSSQANDDDSPAAPLRAVTQPTQVIVQENKPLISQSQPAAVNAGNGGSSSSASPVTSTRSSK